MAYSKHNLLHTLFALVFISSHALADEPASLSKIVAKPDLFQPLTEPPCSYCSTQHRKGFVHDDDLVLSWIRGAHNGGAISVRHFLSAPRVINDTYGLFFYDPDGGYVAAYKKDYGYQFYGWRRGVMIVKGRDGTLWSALTGRALEGPLKGNQLERIPSLTTTWGYWMMLHPESTAYDLFDGKKYPMAPLPHELSPEAKATMEEGDERLPSMSLVLGIDDGKHQKAFAINDTAERDCQLGDVGETPVAAFWYGPTKTAVAFDRRIEGQTLTLYADSISPESAPFKDKETDSRWTIAGRAVDGPLRGKELTWVSSIQCRWYAWSAEFPDSPIHKADEKNGQ